MRSFRMTLAGMVVMMFAACATTTAPSATLTPAAPTEPSQPMQTEEITSNPTAAQEAAPTDAEAAPTAAEAAQFVAESEAKLAAMNVDAQRASWVQSTFITYDTQILSAKENEKLINAGVEMAKQAARFDKLDLPYDVRRKLEIIKLSLTSPGPADPTLTADMARIASELEATYGSGKYCPPGKTGDACLDINEITNVMRTSHKPDELLDAWRGWHTVAPPMRDRLHALRRADEPGRARARLSRRRRDVALEVRHAARRLRRRGRSALGTGQAAL